MKFLREHFEDVQVITESRDGKKELYIEGIFAQAVKKNRNGRIYPKPVMEQAVEKYVNEWVNNRRAIGELSHPEARPMPKPNLASHLVTSLKMEGNDVIGKARILPTPEGNTLRGLLEGGVQLGVSTRALGSVKESTDGILVQPDYQLFAIDAVSDPSGIDCWVNAINESQEWVVTGDGQILEKYQAELKKPKLNEERMFQLFANFLSDIAAK